MNSVETGFNACFFLHWNGLYSKKYRYKYRDLLLCIGCTPQNSMLEYCAHNVKKKNETKWGKNGVLPHH